MKIEELLKNIEKETNICKSLEERIGRINSVRFTVEFPATEKTYDPASAWGSDNSFSESIEYVDKALFGKIKNIYIEHVNKELKRHKEALNNLLNKKEKIEKILSE